MAQLGRPRVLDDGKQREICAILAVGSSRRTAARYVGCAVCTIRRTALLDAEFDARLRKSESQYEIVNLQNIHTAGKKNWRAAAWSLERRFPDRYGQRSPGTVTVEQISQMLTQFSQIILEEVPEAHCRKKILKRLDDLTKGLKSADTKLTAAKS